MTPNLRYINQSAPFWDWIASFEQSAAEHPYFGGNNAAAGSGDERTGPPQPPHAGGPWGGWANPWARGFSNWHGGELPHRGGPPHSHHHQHPHGHGPPAPPPQGPPPHYQDEGVINTSGEEYSADEKVKDGEADKEKGTAPDPPEEAPQASDRETRRCARRDRRHERHEARHEARQCRRGRGGPGTGAGAGWGPFGGHGPHHHGFGRGGWGGMPGRGGFRMLSELFGPGGPNEANNDADWKPEADAFDTETSYVVHISLPGAHKDDIGVTWDAEKSELTVAGVVHRPGDEAFLKTLALDERKTGAFERKVRLGTRALPAHVDVEGISAKLENGILIVDVPKLNGEFVEVKKVDIE